VRDQVRLSASSAQKTLWLYASLSFIFTSSCI